MDSNIEKVADRLRARVSSGERVLFGWSGDGEPVTLAIGEGLGAGTRPGALLARLLAAGPGPWSIASVRPGGAPLARECEAANRLRIAADVLGLPLENVVVVGTRRVWTLAPGE